MSDTSQGPGWWQASDGKWYPPEQAPGYQPPAGGPVAGGTSLGETLSYAWNKFVQNIGEWILLWLIYFVIAVAVGLLAFFVAVGGSATVGLRFNVFGLVLGLLAGIVQGVLLVVVARGAVMATNGQKVDIGQAFKLTGNNIAAGVVFGVIYGVLNSLCFLFGIAAWIFFAFMPVLSALDDKGAESIGESASLSTSHPGEAMLFMLLSWLITGCTCGIGGPISMLGGVYLARRYRGEEVAA